MPNDTAPALVPLAWLAIADATDADGFFLQGAEAEQAERAALAAAGAPDTDALVFLSIAAEDRDSAMVEAKATPAFVAWAQAPYGATDGGPVDNGDANLVYYAE
jgi:hypothetical protein